MFMNEYRHTIDAKGRMILPARFREELGTRFVLSRGIDQCLTIYPMEHWQTLTTSLQKLSFTKSNVRKLRRFLIGSSTEMECDRQGRILIPAHLREYAGLKKEALVIGTGATIEIWNPAVLDAANGDDESIADLAESLDIPMDFDL